MTPERLNESWSCFCVFPVQVKQLTGTTADIFLEYIQRNLPEGVSMSVYQVSARWEALPRLTQIGAILNRCWELCIVRS